MKTRISTAAAFASLLLFVFSVSAQAQTLTLAISPSHPSPYIPYEEVPNPEATKFDAIKNKRQHIMVRAGEQAPTREQAWQAVIKELSQRSGVDLKLVIPKERLAFELAMNKGEFDLAYLDPMQFVAFKQHPKYNAFAKRRAQPIKGLIVVRQDSSSTDINELKAATIGYPDPLSFGGSIVPRESLRRIGVDYQPKFYASADLTFKALLKQEVAAIATRDEDLKGQDLSTQQKVKILWSSPGFTPYAFAAHPRVSFFTINRLQRALINMDRTEEGRNLLADIFVANGFETASNSDWHDVESIDINKLPGATAN